MNNRKLRDSQSHMRGSAKNLQDLGSLRDSGSLEAAMNEFSIKKQKRINGVQLAPLNHPGGLKSGVNILSQNRASIPLSSRANGGVEALSNGHDQKMTAAEISSMALL